MLQFTQQEVEKAFDDILKHADRVQIARITGIYPGVIDGMFNPADERKCALFVALQILCAEDDVSDERGDELFQKVVEFRQLSKKRKSPVKANLNLETGKLNSEIADFVRAKLESKPYAQQFKELLEAEQQLEVVKKALIDEYNELKEKSPEPTFSVTGVGNN